MPKPVPHLDTATSVSRRGSAMVETLIAIALLSVVLGLTATLGSTMLKHRKLIQQHRVALEAKANLMTFAMATPFESLSEPQLQTHAKTLTADDDASWDIRVQDDDGAKKISADVTFGPNQVPTAAPRKPLVAWRYDIENAKPETQP